MASDDKVLTTFTITLDANGRLVRVKGKPRRDTVTRLNRRFRVPGEVRAFSAIVLLKTKENPTCWYLGTGGAAFKICR